MIARAAEGDGNAFAALVRRHAPLAKRMAVLWGAGADADDVVQDAFVKAFKALPRYRMEGDFRPWLLRIVRNETYNLFRSRGRRSLREQQAEWLVEPADPEAAAIGTVRRRRLLTAVQALPTPLQEVVRCRYLLELSEAETAIALRIPAGTVKSRLHRAMAALRKEVGDER